MAAAKTENSSEETAASATTVSEEFVITRVLNAPRELVWKAYTEPERLAQWWGPKGFTCVSTKVDLRPGGTFHYCLRSPGGQEMWGKWTYREVVAPERMTTIVSFSDEKGNATRHPMSPTWPLEMLSTMTLTEQGDKTTITVTAAPYNSSETERETFEAGQEGLNQGFGGTLDQLVEYLANAQN